MAIIRPYRPNLAEFCWYRSLLERFSLNFFYTGPPLADCQAQLREMPIEGAGLVRYRSYTDWLNWQPLQRALDFKLGLGSVMLSHLRDVLEHDYVNVVDPIYAFAWQIAPRLRSRQKLIVVRWENQHDRYGRVWLAAQRAPRVLARADHIICVTQAAFHTLALPCEFTGKVTQIYPGILLPAHSCVDASSAHSHAQPKPAFPAALLFVGRLQWSKGLHTLLGALSILRKQCGLRPELYVIGGGDQRPPKALARQLDLESQVAFLGRVAHAEVRRRMRQTYAFCFPSLLSPNWMEQYGFALVEAMAHGLPVVTFDTGSIREVCGEDALYASAGNAHSLAQALARLLLNPEEAAFRGERLRQRAYREFSAEQQGRRLLEFLS